MSAVPLSRRSFLVFTAAVIGAPLTRYVYAGDTVIEPSGLDQMLLSEYGCGRATAYNESNKIVTVGDRTHVAWLDSADSRFLVRIRTFDHTSGKWTATKTLGEAQDNHGGPALAVDSRGYLHVVYYPHHKPFKYQRSRRPNDISSWTTVKEVGTLCTYPCLLCAPDDELLLLARESRGDRQVKGQEPWNMTWHVNLYRKPSGGAWGRPAAIIHAQHVGYSHYQAEFTWGPDHRTLHLVTRIRERQGAWEETIGYMASDDAGKTWRRSDGTSIALPATAKTIDIIERGGTLLEKRTTLLSGGVAVDANGSPHVLYTVRQSNGVSEAFVATPDGKGNWGRTPLSDYLPPDVAGHNLTFSGGLTSTRSGKLIAAVTSYAGNKHAESWAGTSNEIVCFESDNAGESFTGRLLSTPDASTPHWLPNIERPTGHNTVSDRPGVIYTAGISGKSGHDILSNKVMWGQL